jgi:hypothetical protein
VDETILDEISNHLSLMIFELKERFSDSKFRIPD